MSWISDQRKIGWDDIYDIYSESESESECYKRKGWMSVLDVREEEIIQ